MHPPRGQDGQHSVAFRNGALDDLAVVGGAGNDGDAPLERIQLRHALLPADGDDLVAAIERVLHHVVPQLSGGADDADSHALLIAPSRNAASRYTASDE